MRIVGLTGNMGSGKSTVTRFFQALGYNIIIADELSRKAVENKETHEKIVLEFGKSVENLDGSLHRQHLAEIIFSDAKKLNRLNQIVHPQVKELFWVEIKNLYKKKERAFVIYEIPLLFEVNMQSSFQKTILVISEENLMISRKAKETGLSPNHIQKRLSFQMDPKYKKQKADFVVENQENLEDTKKKVSVLSKKLQKLEELDLTQIENLIKRTA